LFGKLLELFLETATNTTVAAATVGQDYSKENIFEINAVF